MRLLAHLAPLLAALLGAAAAHAQSKPPAAAPPTEVGGAISTAAACESDSQCPAGRFCDEGECKATLRYPWHIRWHRQRTTYTVVGPYVSQSDRRGSTSTFLGLVWHWQDRQANASTTLGFPLFLWHRAPGEQGGVVGPAFGYRDAKGWLGGLAPLLFVGNREGRSHQVIPPLLFGHTRDARTGTDTTVFAPIFVQQRRDGWDAGVFPAFFAGRRGERRYALIPGLYYHRSGPRDMTHVLGPLYFARGERSYAAGLAPIFHVSSSPAGSLRWCLPLLYFHRDTPSHSLTLIGPFFAAERPGQRTAGFYPLVWYARSGPRKVLLGLPLFAYAGDTSTGQRDFWLGPFLRLHRPQEKKTTHVFFPLVVDHREPDYHVTVQFPFFWRVRDGSAVTTAVFPFYLRTRREGLAADIAFPLVWRFRLGKATTTVAGPIFWRHDGGTHFGIVPLGGGGWGQGKRYAWVPPLLFWHSADAASGKQLTVFGPFFRDRTPSSWTAGLVPLVFGWRRGPITSWLAPLFFSRRDQDNDRKATAFGPLYFGHYQTYRYGGLAPLFFYSSPAAGRWQATLLPLFHFAKKADGSRLITLVTGYSTYDGGGRGYFGPLYMRHDRDGWGAGLFPLFYHDTNRRHGTTTSLFLPLFLRRVTPETSLLGVTPLVWHYRSVESTTTVAFPFFFEQLTQYEKRTSVLFPLGLRHKNYATNATTWVAPLLYLRSSPTTTEFVFFPLVWRLGEPGSRGTAVFPLFWDFRRGESITQMFLPFYVFVRRPNADHIVVLNCYFRRGRGPNEGSYSFHFIPLFDVGRPHPGDYEWNLFEGLIGYSRVGRTRRVKLLWSIEIPLEPTKSSATSFFDPTPMSQRRAMY